MGRALRFLTILPVPGRHRPPDARALLAFPVVGLLVGLAWAATASTDRLFTNTGVAAALVLLVDAVLTGALHLDALADVTDGVASRRRREEAVRIMRDSAVGAVGALAVVLVTLLRHAALIGLVSYLPLLIVAPVVGRVAMVLVMAIVPPRADGSLAAALGRPTGNVVVGVSLLGALFIALADPRGLFALLLGLVWVVAFAAWWRRRFGELTGDAAGACGITAETLALVVLAALRGL